MSTQPHRTPGRAARAAHLAWAALAVFASAVLVLVPQRGHPPPIVLLPLVALAWPVGHVAIWGVARLAARGRQGGAGGSGSARSWPVALIPVLIGTGIASAIGFVQLAGTGLQGKWYPYGDPVLWAGMLATWSAHGACFAGLLLRRKWSRFLGAIVACGWALLLAAQVVEHVTSPRRNAPAELVVAIALLLLLAGLAVHLVVSRGVRSFLSR